MAFKWARSQMLNQAGIGRRPNSAQEDEIGIILVGGDLEIIPGLNLPALTNSFGNYELTALSDCCRHRV